MPNIAIIARRPFAWSFMRDDGCSVADGVCFHVGSYHRAERTHCELPLLSLHSETDRCSVADGVLFHFGSYHYAERNRWGLPHLSLHAGADRCSVADGVRFHFARTIKLYACLAPCFFNQLSPVPALSAHCWSPTAYHKQAVVVCEKREHNELTDQHHTHHCTGVDHHRDTADQTP